MTIEHRIEQVISGDGFRFNSITLLYPTCESYIEETIPDGSSDLQIIIAANQASLVSFILWSDQNLSILTQSPSSGSPQDNFSLKANKPIVWCEGMANVPIAGNVTVAYAANASGENATLRWLMGWDATP